jgi:hypothetical protein
MIGQGFPAAIEIVFVVVVVANMSRLPDSDLDSDRYDSWCFSEVNIPR